MSSASTATAAMSRSSIGACCEAEEVRCVFVRPQAHPLRAARAHGVELHLSMWTHNRVLVLHVSMCRVAGHGRPSAFPHRRSAHARSA